MNTLNTPQTHSPSFPSIDDVCPEEEGGPIARTGFTYQDEIAVGFFIEMLGNPDLIKVHCETHDDILLVRSIGGHQHAEFVQVKAGEINKLWSVADLCRGEAGKTGDSIFEVSLSRDAHHEPSLFRIVTLRPVVDELKILSYPRKAPGREMLGAPMTNLKAEIDSRCVAACSKKGNTSDFWLERCVWDVRHDQRSIIHANIIALLAVARAEHITLLYEQAEVLLEELRVWAKEAGEARWKPNRDKKIVVRADIRDWWLRRTSELIANALTSAGGNLTQKLQDVGADEDLIRLAIELRRDYAGVIRTPQYMSDGQAERLQSRVKSELMTLRVRYAAGQINVNGLNFLAICLERVDQLTGGKAVGKTDDAAFVKGCMYDIADRCLHRFTRSTP